MHIGIGVFMGLYYFSAIMIILNITAFGSEYLEKITKYISSKLTRTRPVQIQQQPAI